MAWMHVAAPFRSSDSFEQNARSCDVSGADGSIGGAPWNVCIISNITIQYPEGSINLRACKSLKTLICRWMVSKTKDLVMLPRWRSRIYLIHIYLYVYIYQCYAVVHGAFWCERKWHEREAYLYGRVVVLVSECVSGCVCSTSPVREILCSFFSDHRFLSIGDCLGFPGSNRASHTHIHTLSLSHTAHSKMGYFRLLCII